jgi:anti-sigma factor RsiW
MNESDYQALVEASWRRPLTVEEQAQLDAWLATRPETRAGWERETGLNHLLGQLPDVPIASNFTSQVLQALEREVAAEARRPSLAERIRRWFRRPAPRIAWASLLLVAAWFGYHQHQTNVQSDMAKGLTVMASVATLSDPTVLQDFDAIQRLSQSAPSDDEELFAVLTK